MLYQNAMDGFEGVIELNMQLGLAPMKIEDWFEPFNDASVPHNVRKYPRTTTLARVLEHR